MKTYNIKYSLIIVLSVILFSSCNIYKPYKTPEVKTDDLYRTTESADTTNIADIPWQEIFTDPHLRSLIDSALTNNFDYRTVMLKVKEAEATLARSTAAFFPSFNLAASEDIAKVQGLKHTEAYSFTGNASWTIDIFGGIQNARKGAKAALMQSVAYKRAVETQLVSGVAISYYTLLALDRQLEISLENEIIFKQTVKTMEGMFEIGTSRAAIEQARASLYSLQASIEGIRKAIRETENAICLLTARPAGVIERGVFADQKLDFIMAIGVPSQLLSNRPDVMQAEAALRYSYAATNVARSAFYPKFTITGTGGYTNGAVVGYTPRWFADFVGGLTMPLLNMGANRANLRIAKAEQEVALLAFRKSLINAGIEVSNALYGYTTTGKKLEARKKQVASMKQAADDTNFAYTRMGASYLEVLTAQQGYLAAQLDLVNDQLSQLTNVVNLYQSLGGGWERPIVEEKK
ncbi:MAG: efflux transporter outer membrane subunit [Flavobacteriales bacterium]|nr:efflux transporter outer membrane subunit [Flavobacteriales bacterium]